MQREAKYPAVHGDSGYAMTVVETPRANVRKFEECPHCHCITDNPCKEQVEKSCWEDWADLLADAKGG